MKPAGLGEWDGIGSYGLETGLGWTARLGSRLASNDLLVAMILKMIGAIGNDLLADRLSLPSWH